jgi:hypothetical protein
MYIWLHSFKSRRNSIYGLVSLYFVADICERGINNVGRIEGSECRIEVGNNN